MTVPSRMGSSAAEPLQASDTTALARRGSLRLALSLGLAFALIWGGLVWRADRMSQEAAGKAVLLAQNLSIAFEENIARTIGNLDLSLLHVRQSYERTQGKGFDVEAELEQLQAMQGLAAQVAVIGEDGLVRQSSGGPLSVKTNVGDQDFFKAHKNGDADKLFIGRTLADAATLRLSVPFSRRLRKADGGFAGVLLLSAESHLLSDFFKSVDIGPSGTVSLAGRDGYLRAGLDLSPAIIDTPIQDGQLFAQLAQNPSGQFFDEKEGGRAIAYRSLMDYPLIVAVGIPVRDMLDILGQEMILEILVGLLLSGLLGVVGWGARQRPAQPGKEAPLPKAGPERFHKVLDSLTEGVAVAGLDGKIVFANPAWQVLARENPALGALGEAAPQADDALGQAIVEVAWGRSSGQSVEYPAQGGEVANLWRRLDILPLSGGGGALMRLADISESRKHAEAQQILEARIALLSEGSLTWHWEMGPDYRFTWLSQSFQALTGQDPRSVLGRHVEAVTGASAQEALAGLLDDFLAYRKIAGFEFSIQDRHGATRTFCLGGEPLFNASGQFAGYRGSVRDVTESGNAQIERQLFLTRLEELEERNHALLNIPGIAAIILDGEGRLVACGAAFLELAGLTREVALGRRLTDWCPEPAAQEAREKLAALRNTPGSFEMTLLCNDAREADILVSGCAAQIGGTDLIMASIQDLTDLKRAEASLDAAQEKIEVLSTAMMDFLKSVGRDIHTQLYSILDLAHLALARKERAPGGDVVDTMKKTAKRLLAVTGGLMDMPGLQTGQLAPAWERFDLERLIGEAVALAADLANVKGVELVVRIKPEVPRLVFGDARRLGRLLLGSLSQAARCTEAGEIVLQVALDGPSGDRPQVRFTIDFSGICGESNGLEDGTVMDMETGAGGSLFRPLVILLGGEVGAATTDGQKSTIWFALPMGTAKAKEQAAPIRLGGRRMLVVDDNPSASEALALMLSELGGEVERLPTGKAALETITAALVSDKPFDVVFIDQGMKDVEGFEAIIRIRGKFGNGKFPHLVLMSDGHLPESETPHLGKPVLRHRLHEVLAQVLGLSMQASAPSASPAQLDPSSLSGTRVLLVEDSPTDQLVARDMLEAVGMNVDTAENGALAVEMVSSNDYQIVLMDVLMPTMGAIEAARRIRLDQRFARLPIIAMTGEDWKDEQEKFIQFGLNDAIFKPVDPDQLYAVIQKWVLGVEARPSLLD
ncbi:MAG: response regulator [Alphaproteobacteria bacterium]|nr:response regulator [Alphaproteobacteria bacterium]